MKLKGNASNKKAPKKVTVSGALAFPRGFEPPACRLGGDRSILLSYGNKYEVFEVIS